MLELLLEVIEEPILNEIKSSQANGLQVYESTDVSMSRQLDLHVRYGDIYFVLMSESHNSRVPLINLRNKNHFS